MCQIDKCEGTESFIAIQRVLRELFTKNHRGVGSIRPPSPSTSAWVKDRDITTDMKLRKRVGRGTYAATVISGVFTVTCSPEVLAPKNVFKPPPERPLIGDNYFTCPATVWSGNLASRPVNRAVCLTVK